MQAKMLEEIADMKAIVEFGIPQAALNGEAPCGISSSPGIIFPSGRQAARAAAQIAFVLFRRNNGSMPGDWSALVPSPDRPRVTWWANDRSAWVCVSLLDGVDRGAFAGTVR